MITVLPQIIKKEIFKILGIPWQGGYKQILSEIEAIEEKSYFK